MQLSFLQLDADPSACHDNLDLATRYSFMPGSTRTHTQLAYYHPRIIEHVLEVKHIPFSAKNVALLKVFLQQVMKSTHSRKTSQHLQ